MDHGTISYQLNSFCKLLNAPVDRMVKKTRAYDFQTILNSIARHFTEY